MLKWIMKQYWRVGQIRALTSLGLGMLVLGRMYFVYVPVLQDMGVFGAIILGTILIFAFLGLGWLYDVRARMWSQKVQCATERSVFQYVPNFKTLASDLPIILVTAQTIKGVLKKIGLSTKGIDNLILLMDNYFPLKPVKRGVVQSQARADEFWDNKANQFTHTGESTSAGIELNSRIKLAFETQMLRLNWIQSLTGLVQDVLIFGAFYVIILYPGIPQELELLVSIVGISLPLLIVLMVAGWFYDKKLRVWSADLIVKIERNPYSYVAEPYLFSMVLPFFYTYLVTLKRVMIKKEMDTTNISGFLEYLSEYTNLIVSNDEDLKGALKLRESLGRLFETTVNGS